MWLQAQRVDALSRRVAELELQIFSLRSAPPSAAPAAPAAPVTPTPEQAPQEELLLTEVVPEDVLILDQPLPEASNDLEDAPPAVPAAKPRMHSPLLLDQPIDDSPRAEPERLPPPPPPKPKAPPRRLDQWLAENGLAWIAGITSAIGAIIFVSVAAQSAWFTAPVRLACASLLGAVLLGVSEWMRRIGAARPPGHPLMSSLLAGAGIVVFYAIVWAAHAAYHFIDWPAAAALLLVCAAALIGLSLLHGEALGVLAIGLALLAPAIASGGLWPSLALTLYVAIVSGGGFALALLRRWAWVALATVAGLYFWFFAAIAVDDVRRALALISFASVGGLLTAFRPPLDDEGKKTLAWSSIHTLGPSVAISVSSALLIWAWLIVAPAPGGVAAGPALISIFHVLLAMYCVRERAAAPVTMVVAIGALVAGFVAYLRTRYIYTDVGTDIYFYPMILLAAFACVASGVFAKPERSGRAVVAAAGAVGAALLALLAAFSRTDWHAPSAYAPLLVTGAVVMLAAWFSERSAEDRKTDKAIAWWAGAGVALLLLTVESLFRADMRSLGHAIVALVLCIGLAWRGWQVLGWGALTATALSLAQAMSPTLIGPTIAGQLPLWVALLTLSSAAILLFAGSTIVRRANAGSNVAEALSAAAVIIALVAIFTGLHWLASRDTTVPLDGFTETSLRVLALMAAGLVVLPRIHETPGPIGAWRGHVLLGLGLAYALLVPGLGINPWWGGPGRAVVNGLPILNALAIAFAAPAALAFWAAGRIYTRQRIFARIYAIAGAALALMWLVLEIRHSFHSGAMAEPALGLFESACYGLAVLAFALAYSVFARMRARRHALGPFTEDLMRSMRAVSWGSMGVAVFIMLLAQHPIWGWHNSEASNAFSTMLAVLAQLVAMALALGLGRALSISRDAEPTRFAAAGAATLFAWSFGHCVIRWLHHRGYMDDGAAPYALEGIAHALWPLILVVAAAQLTRIAPGRDTVRAYLHDLQSIWAAAIWPAMGFAAFGLWAAYNPWWGLWPAQLMHPLGATAALFSYLAAAGLSYVAPDVPHVRGMKWIVPASTVACAAHLFVAATLAVRWLYHGNAMASAQSGEIELWVYSAVWAVFATATLLLGIVRNDSVLRWIGLAVFTVTIVKVFAIDTARLSEIMRAASFVGLSVVAGFAAWMARRNRPAPTPGDLVTVTPSARRERRRVRRRNSQ